MYKTNLCTLCSCYLHVFQDHYSFRKITVLYIFISLKWPLNMLTCLSKIVENLGKEEKNQWMSLRNGKHPNIERWESSYRITEINKRTTLSSLALRYIPLGSGGGIRPSLTFSCSSFCASLLVCLRSFFCSFLVRYTPRVTGVSLSTAR